MGELLGQTWRAVRAITLSVFVAAGSVGLAAVVAGVGESVASGNRWARAVSLAVASLVLAAGLIASACLVALHYTALTLGLAGGAPRQEARSLAQAFRVMGAGRSLLLGLEVLCLLATAPLVVPAVGIVWATASYPIARTQGLGLLASWEIARRNSRLVSAVGGAYCVAAVVAVSLTVLAAAVPEGQKFLGAVVLLSAGVFGSGIFMVLVARSVRILIASGESEA